ncbi:cytochrome c3 family protein [Salinisphaera aquimarina]
MLILVGVLGLGLIAGVLARSDYATTQNRALEQPVPFSHQHHVAGLGIDCQYCHTSVTESQFAGLPPTHTCMTCHSQLWTNADMLAPVRQSLEQNKPLQWQRVHDLADYVYFNHSVHVTNGVPCQACHGRVDKMPLMQQSKSLTMGFCLDCHRDPAPNLRPASAITAMGWKPGPDTPSGHALMKQYGIDPQGLTDCVTCHR